MPYIRTVLGDVPVEEIGIVYTHEHLFTNPVTAQKDPTLAIDCQEKSTRELHLFHKAGGGTLVEATTIDYGRNHEALVKASLDSGVHVIATTGYYLHTFHPSWIANASIEEIAEFLASEVINGIEETKHCAGQIKCAVSSLYMHPDEEKLLRAAAIAQIMTGAPIWIHHGGIMGLEILNTLEKAGANLNAVALGHMDRNPDPYDYRQLARRGCYLSIDNFARVYRYPIQANIDMLKDLLDLGYLNKLLISADFGRSTYYKSYGGGPGLTYLLEKIAPRISEQCGLSQADMDRLLIKNPASLYARF